MRGHVLRLRGLSPRSRWCDKDLVMLHACFQLLVDFLAQEKPQKIVDYTHDRRHREAWKELQALYRYWQVERPRAEREKERALKRWSDSYKHEWVPATDGHGSTLRILHEDKRASARLRKLDAGFDRRESEMLRRLIAIREHLWC